jgi:hypothetical protein
LVGLGDAGAEAGSPVGEEGRFEVVCSMVVKEGHGWVMKSRNVLCGKGSGVFFEEELL